jgi:hypothetical protein
MPKSQEERVAFIMTRIDTGDYDTWRALFDRDVPRAREAATGYRLYRNVENPAEVFIQIELRSADEARVARERLLASGVLDRFPDRSGPTVVELAETVGR